MVEGPAPPGRRSLSATERRWALAALVVAIATVVFVASAAPARMRHHTPYNHFALQAEAWLHGRTHLDGPPPRYAGHNDFAPFEGKTYISFPPFPSVVLLPHVALAGKATAVRDGRVFIGLAGLAPGFLFIALERLRRRERSRLTEKQNVALALLFALGTVYWFSAIQGTVWFAGHVMGTTLLCAALAFGLDGAFPALTGLLLGLALASRPSTAFAFPLFAWELWRTRDDAEAAPPARRAVAFVLPCAAVIVALMAYNHARFGDVFEFGHRHLAVRWRPRIDKWGLFSTHYLGRNLAVMLTGMPFWGPKGLQVNGHGLALWITSPFLAWALWPKKVSPTFRVTAGAALLVALPGLLYQNSGWVQFGYRFSNDFAPLLFLLIALGRRRLGRGFWALAALAIVVNAAGAATFDRAAHRHRYFIDGTQRILHQPD